MSVYIYVYTYPAHEKESCTGNHENIADTVLFDITVSALFLWFIEKCIIIPRAKLIVFNFGLGSLFYNLDIIQ
jgi:hypothetical protein